MPSLQTEQAIEEKMDTIEEILEELVLDAVISVLVKISERRGNDVSPYNTKWLLTPLIPRSSAAGSFIIVFFKDEPVPLPVISFQRERVTTLGSYRIGRNAIGVRQNINLNKIHLDRPLWQTLTTLIHEMCHSWEYVYAPKNKRTKN